MEDIIIKTLAQAPLVALLAYLWWASNKESNKNINALHEQLKAKDEQLKEFIRVFDKMTITLELIKDRLRR